MPFIIVTTVSTSVDTSSPSSSSDGILRLTIKNFKSMTDTVRGESKEIQSIPWFAQNFIRILRKFLFSILENFLHFLLVVKRNLRYYIFLLTAYKIIWNIL